MKTRIEHDTMGEIAVPAEHFWGAQTQRSIQNFPIGGERQPKEIITAFAYLKEACARANEACGKLTAQQAGAIAKACRDIQAKFLLRNGADEVVYPDRDMAAKLSAKLHAQNIFDYVEISQDYAIYEISVPAPWVGKSLRENDIRNKYGVNILAIRDGDRIDPLPSPDFVFTDDDHVFVIGNEATVQALSDK